MYYKINTNFSKTNPVNIAGILSKLLHPSAIPGVKKENEQFHVPFHHEAQVKTIIDLLRYNRSKGFTKKTFEAKLHTCYSEVGFDPDYPEKHLSDSDYFNDWLVAGIIAPV